jgi:hypothetical protein
MRDPASSLNLDLGGGAMTDWTDRVGDCPVLVEAVRRMIPPGGRVLVAGPHPPAVDECLADRQDAVTFLRRSYPDALAIAQRLPDRPGVDVSCGGLDKFDPGIRFDAVVALDGFSRLCSVEGEQLSWADTLDRLAGMLAADGVLVLAVENPLGIHRLVAAGDQPDADDGRWAPTPYEDPTAPRGWTWLAGTVGRSGLAVTAAYAAYPALRPAVIISTEQLGSGRDDLPGWLRNELAAAAASGCPERVVLHDPRRLVGDVLAAGLGSELAPAWLVLARHRERAGRRPELPAALGVSGRRNPFWDVGYELVPSDQDRPATPADRVPGPAAPGATWQRRILGGAGALQPRTIGRVSREPERLTGGPAAGRTLTEVLIELCAAHDLRGLRELLNRYAGWLTEQAAEGGELIGAAGFATTDNVLVVGDGFSLADPSWRLVDPLPRSLALARFLHGFAVTLLTGGFRHPWPPSMDVDSLTVTLAAVAGHPVSRAESGRAAALEAELAAVLDGLTPVEEHRLLRQLNATTTGAYPVGLRGYREAVAAGARLREELDSAREQISWYDEMLTSRERALEKAQRTEAVLLRSISFRVGRFLTAPGRLVRDVVLRLQAPDR